MNFVVCREVFLSNIGIIIEQNMADSSQLILLLFQALTVLKFIYSEKATNFCEISTVDLSYVVTIKYTVEISQNFVAFSEYMNFNACLRLRFLV